MTNDDLGNEERFRERSQDRNALALYSDAYVTGNDLQNVLRNNLGINDLQNVVGNDLQNVLRIRNELSLVPRLDHTTRMRNTRTHATATCAICSRYIMADDKALRELNSLVLIELYIAILSSPCSLCILYLVPVQVGENAAMKVKANAAQNRL